MIVNRTEEPPVNPIIEFLNKQVTEIKARTGEFTPIATLPSEILQYIFTNALFSDYPAICLTCKHFRKHAKDEVMYKLWCAQILGKHGVVPSLPRAGEKWSNARLLSQALYIDQLKLKEKSFIETAHGSLFYGEVYHVDHLLILGSPILKFIEVYDIDRKVFLFRKNDVSEVLGHLNHNLYFNGGLQRSELYVLDLSTREYVIHIKPDELEQQIAKWAPQLTEADRRYAVYMPIIECIILDEGKQLILVNSSGTVSYWDVREPKRPVCTLCFQLFDALVGNGIAVSKMMKSGNFILIKGSSIQDHLFVKVFTIGSKECTDRFLLEDNTADVIANDSIVIRFGTSRIRGFVIDEFGKFKQIWEKTETRVISPDFHFLTKKQPWLFYICEDREEPGEEQELLRILDTTNGHVISSAETAPISHPIPDRPFRSKNRWYLICDDMLLSCTPQEKGTEIKLWGLPTLVSKTVKFEGEAMELYGFWYKGQFLGSPIGYQINSAKIPVFSFN